jgi:hypothetical protein
MILEEGRTIPVRGLYPIVALLLVTATIAMSAGPARAALSCGTVVTSDLVLTEDLVCSGVDALVVGSDGITIDLGGYKIRNTGGGIVNGVTILGHSNVTVQNGKVLGFYRNVIFEDSPNGVALDLVVRRGGGSGLLFFHSDNGTAKRIDVRNVPDAGVDVAFSNSVNISEITVRRAGWGIFVVDSVGTEISNVDVRWSLRGVAVYTAHGTTVTDSVVRNNRDYGVVSEDATKTNILRSTITGNGIGVYYFLQSEGGRVQDNRINNNDIGVYLGAMVGPGLPASADGVQVLDNVVNNNNGSGIVVDLAAQTGLPNRIINNTVKRNGALAAGITNARGDLIVDSRNELFDDGIHIVAPIKAVELGDNRASRNTDYGIEANSAFDLGGNTARRNGNTTQCVGVAC